jgi:cytochrome c biogenesis protein CcdA/thiol-disulfide isomerase/thioredoxin
MLLLFISFIAGILTVLAPCVLPVLPVIIGGSVSGDVKEKARPYIIGISLAFSIILFTLILKVSTVLINLSPSILNWLSGGLLIALGTVTVFPELWEKIVIFFNWEGGSMQLLGKSQKNRGKYASAILIGVALGPVFASCSPTYAFILASILPSSFLAGLVYLSAYATGLALALLGISLVGRRFISRFSWAIDTHGLFRRLLGVLFIIIGITVVTGFEIKVETWIADRLPFDETKVEQVLLSKQQPNSLLKSQVTSASSALNVQSTPAPELQGLTNWINSSPRTLSSLKGKVVLVDFWTYSCINCIRSIPFVEKWYQTYQDQGLVVLGINTPEFAFEHNPANVASAVKSDGITYPVALDNNYATWNAFNNNSWPADYLIDKQGNIRYVSFGEGGYDTTEKAIQELIGINKPLQTPSGYVVPASSSQTPETYFGTTRTANYVGRPNESDVSGGSANFTASSSLSQNEWTLNGNWAIGTDSITSNDNAATLTFHIAAKDAYVIATPPSGAVSSIQVKLPNAKAGQYGSDVSNGTVVIGSSKLYHIVSLNSAGNTTVTLTVPKGTSLFTFTFGS